MWKSFLNTIGLNYVQHGYKHLMVTLSRHYNGLRLDLDLGSSLWFPVDLDSSDLYLEVVGSELAIKLGFSLNETRNLGCFVVVRLFWREQ